MAAKKKSAPKKKSQPARKSTRQPAKKKTTKSAAKSTTAKPLGPYTPVVRAGDWIIVSGQLGVQDGKVVSGKVREALGG